MEPYLVWVRVSPGSPDDRERLARAAGASLAEPFADTSIDGASGDAIVRAVGERHLEVVVDRFRREFGVTGAVSRPRILYRVEPSTTAEGRMKYAAATGGRGHYAHVDLRVDPPGAHHGLEFLNDIAGGAVPEQYVPAVEQGIRDGMAHGLADGFPVEDVRVALRDGSYHDTDSSDHAFRTAAALAFVDAMGRARPRVFEPIMLLEIKPPADCAGQIASSLGQRRGATLAVDERGILRARMPLSELFGLESWLAEVSRRRAIYAIQCDGYREVEQGGLNSDDRASIVPSLRRTPPTRGAAGATVPEPDATGDDVSRNPWDRPLRRSSHT